MAKIFCLTCLNCIVGNTILFRHDLSNIKAYYLYLTAFFAFQLKHFSFDLQIIISYFNAINKF